MPSNFFETERYRIVPHELDQWIIERADRHYRTKTVKFINVKKIWGFLPWRFEDTDTVSEEYFIWREVVIGASSGEVWVPLYSQDQHQKYLNSKEEAKRRIDVRLAKVKADQERADAIAKRLADNPPEEYP